VQDKDTLSNAERAKNVNGLLQVLMDINTLNGGSSDTADKIRIHAKNFEAALFAKSSSKKEYMDSMNEKVAVMRNTYNTRKNAVTA
nr:Chain A, Mediator of RNA polymerase II transcription subunit 15 [Saccharomyces cerevisiae]